MSKVPLLLNGLMQFVEMSLAEKQVDALFKHGMYDAARRSGAEWIEEITHAQDRIGGEILSSLDPIAQFAPAAAELRPH